MKSGKDGIINQHMDATSNVILGNGFYFGTIGSFYCVWTLIKMKPSMFFCIAMHVLGLQFLM